MPKTVKLRIFFSWVLLLCFAAGQYMVYAHQHRTKVHGIVLNKKPVQKTVNERCDLCDAMHHTVMLPAGQLHLPVIYSTKYSHFISAEQHFVPIGLVLSAGRSPPAAKYSV